jgi:hypothetical protein
VSQNVIFNVLCEVTKHLQDVSARTVLFKGLVHKKSVSNLTSNFGEVNLDLAWYNQGYSQEKFKFLSSLQPNTVQYVYPVVLYNRS